MHTETPAALRAAQYVRKSTDHQRYSIEFQKQAIAEYAARNGLTVVESYVDAGRSGLNIEGRPALGKLLDDVKSGRAQFEVVLVYDVSRWGRFQDADESAFYEYSCKRVGIDVHYCAESFGQSDTILSAILKSLKRVMAAEYSRELGVKVYAAQKRGAAAGFWQGSRPGYGLRRAMVDAEGKVLRVLEDGDRKYLQPYHTILVPGPPHEVADVRFIFRQYVTHRRSMTEIARLLNLRFARGGQGRVWRKDHVARILNSPRYVGRNVWNRLSMKLKIKSAPNASDQWVSSNAFTPLVDRSTYEEAQRVRTMGPSRMTDEEVLERLRRLLNKHGALSADMMTSARNLPCAERIGMRFGGLSEVYGRLAFDREQRRAEMRGLHRRLVQEARAKLERLGFTVRFKRGGRGRHTLLIDHEIALHVPTMRCRLTRHGQHRWRLQLGQKAAPGFVLVLRLDADNRALEDRYLLSMDAFSFLPIRDFARRDLATLAPYRLPSFGALRRRHFKPESSVS